MKVNTIPKFDWTRLDDCNMGHTQNEWGVKNKENKTMKLKPIQVYKLTWE